MNKCKKCGDNIQNNAKFCMNCGKKINLDNKPSKLATIIKWIFIGSVITSLSVLHVISRIEIKELQGELEDAEEYTEYADNRLKEAANELRVEKDKADFLDRHIVLVTTVGKSYHRYNCQHVEDRSFWAYNANNAVAKGYEPCLDCNPPQAD